MGASGSAVSDDPREEDRPADLLASWLGVLVLTPWIACVALIAWTAFVIGRESGIW